VLPTTTLSSLTPAGLLRLVWRRLLLLLLLALTLRLLLRLLPELRVASPPPHTGTHLLFHQCRTLREWCSATSLRLVWLSR
jgi:hypothetical protein